MGKLILVILTLLLICCSRKPDFSKIRTGMTTKEAVQMLGKPASRKPMLATEWWLYNDPEKHLLIIKNDTVVKCITQAEAMKIMEETLKNFDSTETK